MDWRHENRKIIKKIFERLKDIAKHSHEGKGNLEPLHYELSGWCSRRITKKYIVYRFDETIFSMPAKVVSPKPLTLMPVSLH